MVARTAEKNASVFRKEGLLAVVQVIQDHLKYDIHYDMCYQHVKYATLQMLGSEQSATERGKALLASDQVSTICEIFGLRDAYERRQEELRRLLLQQSEAVSAVKRDCVNDENSNKRLKANANEHAICVEMSLKFIRSLFHEHNLPKVLVANYANAKLISNPVYKTTQIEKHFYSELTTNGVTFRNTYLEKNKKFAEQAVALVACKYFNLISDDVIKESAVIPAPHERTLQNVN